MSSDSDEDNVIQAFSVRASVEREGRPRYHLRVLQSVPPAGFPAVGIYQSPVSLGRGQAATTETTAETRLPERTAGVPFGGPDPFRHSCETRKG